MAQGNTDVAESPLKQTTDVEANPYKRPTVNRRHQRKRSFSEWWSILPYPYKFFIVLIAISVLLVTGLYIKKWFNSNANNQNDANKKAKWIPNPEIPLPPSASTLHVFKDGAVCSDAGICSKIGKDVLEKSGNVADSALATLFCNGILTMQSMGIGGGFIMNIYISKEKKAYTLNAKEVSPAAAKDDLYKKPNDNLFGPHGIATPGEVKGYWELHKRFGSLPWKELIEPSIELCEEGFILTKHMADTLEPHLLNDTYFKNTFYNNVTGQFHKYGEHILPPQQLCETYKRIADNGGEDFYSGELADDIAADLKELGSVITRKDLEAYKVRWSDSIAVPILDQKIYVTPPPSNGLLVAFIVNILKGYNLTSDSLSTLDKEALTLHRYTEAMKFAFGKRTLFSDPDFINVDKLVADLTSAEYAESIRKKIDDTKTYQTFEHYGAEFRNKTEYGTSHVSIVGTNGDAISVTTSINYYYGAGLIGRRTGIIFNSGMNDFAMPNLDNIFFLPPSANNFMAPYKRAVSSMSPTIITDSSDDVRLVIGAAGGTKIVSAISSVILRTTYFKQNLKEAIDAPRIHHQVAPMELEYEYGNTQQIVDKLATFGHKLVRFDHRGAIICALSKNATGVYANADYRKAGDVFGL